MSDTINTIINAVKEMVNDMGDKVTTAVKESLHVPENLGPLVTTLKDLVSTGKKVRFTMYPHFLTFFCLFLSLGPFKTRLPFLVPSLPSSSPPAKAAVTNSQALPLN